MPLTARAIHNSTTVYTLIIILLLAGAVSFFSLPKQQDPGFTIRAAVINTRLPGATPRQVEALVTDKIEKAIQEIPELDNVTSESTQGRSFVVANFQEKYQDMRPIFDKLRRKIADISDDLPAGIVGPEINDEYGDVFGMVYVLRGEGFNFKELSDIADAIRDQLLKVPDVAKVQIKGAQKEVVFVEYNNVRLRELGLAPQQLVAILQSVNVLRPGGSISLGRERIPLEPTGNYQSLEDIRKTVITLPGSGQVVYLEDIADIYRGYEDPKKNIIHANGSPALVFALSLREGGNIMELGKQLEILIPQLQASYPHGISIDPIYLQAELVGNAVSGFMSNLGQAILIVVLVMLAFLGLRTGLIVAALVPSTILVTLVLMESFGITINKVSLASLIIALGLLVDNAIVMAEAILSRRQQGLTAVDAAIVSGREMAIPLLTSSLTTSAAFLAIFLAESAIGEYTADIFKVVSIALLSSWVLAMTLIPLLTIAFMQVKQAGQTDTFDTVPYRRYRQLLLWSVKHKLIFCTAVVLVFFLTLEGLGWVPKVFIPPRTDPVINAEFNMPFGTDIETTEAAISDIEAFLQERYRVTSNRSQGIEEWVAFIGESAPRYELAIDPGSANPRASKFIINTSSAEVIPAIIRDTLAYTSEQYPDLETIMKKLENGTPIRYPVQIRISGNDIDRLYQIVTSIKAQLYKTPGVATVNDDWGSRTKKLIVRVDQERARRAGVSSEDVAISLQSSLSGIELTEYREGSDLIPVTLRSVSAERQDLGKLDNITVYSTAGATVPLKQVADVNIQWQSGIIRRRDRERTITVQAQLLPQITVNQVNTTLLPWLKQAGKSWPDGYRYELGGESETSGDANEAIAAKLPISGMLILLLLVAQFNSVRKPLIILATIPLGLIGITCGLLLANSIFGFFTILGVVSLSGIIINNAIVLLDRIQIEINENNLAPNQAVIQACQQRLRPIILTTLTTVGGMLPLWISHDPMFETMAITIIFGLVFATLLTLLVVPVLYSILFRVNYD